MDFLMDNWIIVVIIILIGIAIGAYFIFPSVIEWFMGLFGSFGRSKEEEPKLPEVKM
jgi:hypothetical protein